MESLPFGNCSRQVYVIHTYTNVALFLVKTSLKEGKSSIFIGQSCYFLFLKEERKIRRLR